MISMLSRVGSFVSLRLRLAEDWWFDTWNRVDTRSDPTWQRAADTLGPARDGHMYLPARARNVRASLRALPLSDRAEYTFLDMGSGKGRVVLLAAELPFKRVIGVEYSASLDQQARANLQACRNKAKGCKDVELKHADAASYVFPGGNLVIYLFNPFGPDVMSRMLRNLQSSIKAEPRHVILVLLWPELSDMVAQVPGMRLSSRTRRYEILEMGR